MDLGWKIWVAIVAEVVLLMALGQGIMWVIGATVGLDSLFVGPLLLVALGVMILVALPVHTRLRRWSDPDD